MSQTINDHSSLIDHVMAVGVIGVVTEILPTVVALLAIIWYLIRIGEWCYEKYHNYKAKSNG